MNKRKKIKIREGLELAAHLVEEECEHSDAGHCTSCTLRHITNLGNKQHREAIAEERERCAKVAESFDYQPEEASYNIGFAEARDKIAAAIREEPDDRKCPECGYDSDECYCGFCKDGQGK